MENQKLTSIFNFELKIKWTNDPRTLLIKNQIVFVIMYKIKGFREKVECVFLVSTFLVSMFADQLLLAVDEFF